MDWLLNYFNLSAPAWIHVVYPEPIPLPWQLALYGALVLGILANGFLVAARTGRRFRFQVKRLLVSAIIGLVIFPAVYEGAKANLDQPTLVQLALIFAAGLGYESAFAGILGLVGLQDKR